MANIDGGECRSSVNGCSLVTIYGGQFLRGGQQLLESNDLILMF